MPSYVVQLNNYLQRQNQLAAIHWGEHQITTHPKGWKMIVFINGVEYGQAFDPQKGAAKDMAAKEALQKLNQAV